MGTFEFSIIASGLDPAADDFEQRFYDAGCDDALVAFQKGHIIVDFAREAETIEDAIGSAIEAVLTAGAHVERVEPDPLVSLADIAARSGLTRAAVSLYFKGERGKGFPAPVARVTGDSPLWDWSTVAQWLYAHQRLGVEHVVAAEAVKVANTAIDHQEPHLADVVRRSVHAYRARLHEDAAAAG